jgi:hypothetical protein
MPRFESQMTLLGRRAAGMEATFHRLDTDNLVMLTFDDGTADHMRGCARAGGGQENDDH